MYRILQRIESKLDYLIKKEKHMESTLDQVLADVTAETTLEQGVVTLLNNVESQLAAALANTSVNPEDQAKINQIFSALEANKTSLSAAIAANTPAAPVDAPVTEQSPVADVSDEGVKDS